MMEYLLLILSNNKEHSQQTTMGLIRTFFMLVFMYTSPSYCDQPGLRSASACYGTTNNFLELACEKGEEIKVMEVLYGAKLKSGGCPEPPISSTDIPASCCYYMDTDCAFTLRVGMSNFQDPFMKLCAGKQTCSQRTTWFDTTGHCSEDYMPNTNYMQLSFICLKDGMEVPYRATTRPSTTTLTSTLHVETTPHIPTAKPTTVTTATTKEHVPHEHTTKPIQEYTTSTTAVITKVVQPDPTTPPRASSDRHIEVNVSFTTSPSPVKSSSSSSSSSFAFTTGIMGGIAAAIIGLLLTVFGFLFYWGRRKRKLVTTKSGSSTVWDFLLAHTVAARTFRRGYDNFSNNRESVSSEGGTEQTVGKQTWLPNIRVEPNIDTQSVTSDDNVSIVNINTLGSNRSENGDRSEA